jgi:hypothetical protein
LRGLCSGTSRKLRVERLKFFKDFREFLSKRSPFFRCEINRPLAIRTAEFFTAYNESHGCMEYLGQCGQDTGISRTLLNSSLGMADPQSLPAKLIDFFSDQESNPRSPRPAAQLFKSVCECASKKNTIPKKQ